MAGFFIMSEPIKLIVGLGNPGKEYEATRHNAGFWWVDELARQQSVAFKADNKFHGLIAKAGLHGHEVHLLKPQTFMNLSGKSVAALARFFKIAPEEILVVHDELDLPPGSRAVAAHVAGNVWAIPAEVGSKVKAGDTLVVIESMKMEIAVVAPCDGVVIQMSCRTGGQVAAGQDLLVIQAEVN